MKARLCIVQDSPAHASPTFLRAHAENLPAQVLVVHGVVQPEVNGQPVLGQSLFARGLRKASRVFLRRDWSWEQTCGYRKVFRQFRPDAVLAEFGASGVR